MRPGDIQTVLRRIDPTGGIWDDIEETVRDIILDVGAQLSVRLGGREVPDELTYIVTDVSVEKYNRIGSEGTSSHTVEGETMTFAADPFDRFRDDIEAWRNANSAGRSRVRFI